MNVDKTSEGLAVLRLQIKDLVAEILRLQDGLEIALSSSPLSSGDIDQITNLKEMKGDVAPFSLGTFRRLSRQTDPLSGTVVDITPPGERGVSAPLKTAAPPFPHEAVTPQMDHCCPIYATDESAETTLCELDEAQLELLDTQKRLTVAESEACLLKEEARKISQELFLMKAEREFWFVKARRGCEADPSVEEIDNEGQPDEVCSRSEFVAMVTEYEREMALRKSTREIKEDSDVTACMQSFTYASSAPLSPSDTISTTDLSCEEILHVPCHLHIPSLDTIDYLNPAGFCISNGKETLSDHNESLIEEKALIEGPKRCLMTSDASGDDCSIVSLITADISCSSDKSLIEKKSLIKESKEYQMTSDASMYDCDPASLITAAMRFSYDNIISSNAKNDMAALVMKEVGAFLSTEHLKPPETKAAKVNLYEPLQQVQVKHQVSNVLLVLL